MGSPSPVLALLLPFWALPAAGLGVQQSPAALRVRPGGRAALACAVRGPRAWEQLRAAWAKDGRALCQLRVPAAGGQRSGRCGAAGLLSWREPGDLTLTLAPVRAGDAGNYTCRVTVEIPELQEAEGGGTRLLVQPDDPWLDATSSPSFPGLLLALLVAAGTAVALAVALAALGTRIWSRCRRGREDSGNPLYCNVLNWRRETPEKKEDGPGEGVTLGLPEEDQKGHRIYSTALPPPAPCPLRPVPTPWPRAISPSPERPSGVSPGPGPSG